MIEQAGHWMGSRFYNLLLKIVFSYKLGTGFVVHWSKLWIFKEVYYINVNSFYIGRIMQTRHNVTYYLPCGLVLNWPAVDLLTFVHCIYQRRLSRYWAVFLLPDRATLDGMPHRRYYTFCFCTHHQRIDFDNLTKCCSATQIFVMVMPERCSPQRAALWYRLLAALRTGNKYIFHLRFSKEWNKALNKIGAMFLRK